MCLGKPQLLAKFEVAGFIFYGNIRESVFERQMPSLSSLQQLMHICELELEWLNLTINAKKSTCLRIGPRFNVKCSNITTKAGDEVIWHSEIRYLGVYLTAAREYRCYHSNAKQSFYRSFNAVFGKVGRCASEDVIVELLKTKCLPSLLYGIKHVLLTSQ